MKKYSLLLITLLQSIIVLGQDPTIKTDLPTVIPPSPTVAGLMKFEETPVSNYTGVPDISIPLFSTTASHGLNISISLSYHPASVKKEDIAGFTGLGWSLIAGGSISRTIRDIPDDFYGTTGSTPNFKTKIGIYHRSASYINHDNNYYDIIPLLTPNYNFDHEDEEINRFLFESGVKQLIDTKHDLYQFNFMGYSGRFIIEKKPNGSFEVVKLDKNNLIINFDSTAKTFTVKDTKGFTYVFDVKEESTSSTYNHGYKFDFTTEIGPSSSPGYTYTSAFQLSKILFDTETVVEFTFDPYEEKQRVRSSTYNTPIAAQGTPSLQNLLNTLHHGTAGNLLDVVLPSSMDQITTSTILTKKIKQININGRAIINFDILTGLTYSNPAGLTINHCLKSITIKNMNSTTVKKYTFNYLLQHKLFLDEIKEGVSTDEISQYQFRYNNLDLDYNDFSADYWGYYRWDDNDISCTTIQNFKRDADIVYCKKDALKQIIYPTKGSAIFEFESNNYSYIGDDDSYYTEWESQNFDPNPYNWTTSDFDSFSLDNTNGNTTQGTEIYSLFGGQQITSNKILIFTTSLSNEISFLTLKKINPANNAIVETRGLNTSGCPNQITLESGFKYEVHFDWIDYTVFSGATIIIKQKTRNTTTKKADYGGGIRIKNIYYTTDVTPEMETQDFPNSYIKKTSFDYNLFDDADRSSGSLVYPKPKLQYEDRKKIDMIAIGNVGQGLAFSEIHYSIFSTTNNLSFLSTKGSDVGYKNVKVSETGNGKTEYVYSSPIDYAELLQSANVAPPFASPTSIDYKRGNLEEERKYDQSGRIISKMQNQYLFENSDKITGVSTFTLPYGTFCYDCPYAGHYSYYANYRSGFLDPNTYCCEPNPTTGLPMIVGTLLNYNVRFCGDFISAFISYYLQREGYGWAKLDNTVSKQYFYDSVGSQSVVEKSTAYTYNSQNMQLATTLDTYSTGETTETKIYYPVDSQTVSEPYRQLLIDKNMIDTPLKIESYDNGSKVAEQKVIYNNWGSDLLLPQIIQTAKGTASLENRVRYNAYDKYGHPIEVQQENGTVISYLWGYNQSQPIAKIENATNAQIKSALGITDLNLVTEANLGTINGWRTNASFVNAMITTYTYSPLFGVSTITDPKGDIIRYFYDSFGRLSQVKDKDNKILSENEYHYKN